MLKRPLARKHHADLGVGPVAGFNNLKVSHGTARLYNGGDPFLNPHIHAVSERKECIRNRTGTDKAALCVLGLRIDLPANPRSNPGQGN